jgi:hypothetical protein
MEVHQHAHHEGKKSWKAYFWEFLMLFLAVFCGFLAENQREHMVERQREKQYIRSLVKDVQLDIISLQRSHDIRAQYITWYDSLVYMLKNYNDSSLNDIYFYARHLGRKTDFDYHDGTILQLKNSGGLRLIHEQSVADSIIIYDNESIRRIMSQQEMEPQFRNDILSNYIGKLFDAMPWNQIVDDTAGIHRPVNYPPLLTRDPLVLNDLAIHVSTLKTSYRITNGYIEKTIKTGTNLIAFLKNEYDLD